MGRAGHAQAEDIDKQRVQHHVHAVGDGADDHGRFGVPHRPQRVAQHRADRAEHQRQADDEEITGRLGLDGRLGAHPHRDVRAQSNGKDLQHRAGRHGQQKRLLGQLAHLVLVAGARRAGDQHHHGGADGAGDAVDQPGHRGGGADGGGGLLAQLAHHGGVHILQKGREHLLYNGGDGQKHQRAEQRRSGRRKQGGAFGHTGATSLQWIFGRPAGQPTTSIRQRRPKGKYLLAMAGDSKLLWQTKSPAGRQGSACRVSRHAAKGATVAHGGA